ncbi:ABC transporter permease [Pseudoxanthomonas sp. LARHCG66]
MNLWRYEWRLLLRSRIPAIGLLVLTALTVASLVSGVQRIDSQREAIARIATLQAADSAAVAAAHGKSTDAGQAAYYSFHSTWNPPSALSFAAVGMRDVAPFMLRVRALGLEAQIHDGDVFNPELALAGRFDFAFLLTFLLPVFVIVLFHDLRSNETESGRERMLRSLPMGLGRLYLRKAMVRALALLACVGVPFMVVALQQGVTLSKIAGVLGLATAYLVFWAGLSLLVTRHGWSSATNAATLAASWVAIALVLPALAHVAIERAIPVDQGAEIARAQREAVNRAWDIPREDTMKRFYARYPEWSDSPPLGTAFHYKWYLAFHQNGDDDVAQMAADYRAGIEHRSVAASNLGWLLPPVGMQAALTRLADTDMQAHLAYQDRIRAYHADLRVYYYRFLFRDEPFRQADYSRAPVFEPD